MSSEQEFYLWPARYFSYEFWAKPRLGDVHEMGHESKAYISFHTDQQGGTCKGRPSANTHLHWGYKAELRIPFRAQCIT